MTSGKIREVALRHFTRNGYKGASLADISAEAIWTGIGTVGGAVVGMFFFGESKEWRRILFITMVLTAAVGLKLTS